jgi:tRNA-splicing ligase RtcB (3'-phosphate/5'-hydroxy nucleic acid ligase)
VHYVAGIPVWGQHDDKTLEQIKRVAADKRAVRAALMADGHVGYAMPIGGVVAYRDAVSPNGVGFDISCGNKAAKTNVRAADITGEAPRIMDEIFDRVAFGIGVSSGQARDHPLFDDRTWNEIPEVGALKDSARKQLGSVGSGNHYVDIFQDEDGWVWIGVHFGSRGLGHKTCTGFMNLAHGMAWDDRPRGESMEAPATVLNLGTALGDNYWAAMELAGRYASAGRDIVVQQVAGILGAELVDEVHNHHNYAWREHHGGEELIVVRKGATPAQPGQRGFIGGSMGDDAVIAEGTGESAGGDREQATSLWSTVHGAGRVMSRRQAAGKVRWRRGPDGRRRQERIAPGAVDPDEMQAWLERAGVELRGGGLDEAPQVYRRLPEVLKEHGNTIRIVHRLRPLGVAMAGADVFDPYKD